MPEKKLPLISCLCITKNNTEYLSRSIGCFLDQTYANKELIIISDGNDNTVRQLISKHEGVPIRSYSVPLSPKLSLGLLRNMSIDKAEGEYICQWDDDDWYHQERLERQFNSLMDSHKAACFLAYWLNYDVATDCAYLFPASPFPASIMCKRSLLIEDHRYSDRHRDEDYELMVSLIKNNHAFPLVMPSLYIYYCRHGNNTCTDDHFRNILATSLPLPVQTTDLFRKIFRNELSASEASALVTSQEILGPLNYFTELLKA
jgi:glycosyltransferase involved in cell wall biosynthesis